MEVVKETLKGSEVEVEWQPLILEEAREGSGKVVEACVSEGEGVILKIIKEWR